MPETSQQQLGPVEQGAVRFALIVAFSVLAWIVVFGIGQAMVSKDIAAVASGLVILAIFVYFTLIEERVEP